MPKNSIFRHVYVSCSNCGDHRTYIIDLTSGTSTLAHQLYDDGFRYNGVVYCPECVRTWPERNKMAFDEQYLNRENDFATYLARRAY